MAKEAPIDLSLGDLLPTGSRIRLRRHVLGVRLSSLAREIGYDRGYLSQVENNKPGGDSPSDELLEKLAQRLDIPKQVLIEGPLTQLTNGSSPEQFATMTSTLKREGYQPRPRSGVARINRIMAMGHLTPQEEAAVVEQLVSHASSLVDFVKSLRPTQGGN